MFGWLATRSLPLCSHAAPVAVSQRSRRIAPEAWIRALPGLGSVLYLHRTSRVPEDAVSPGALVAHHHLAPLLDIHTLVTTSVITDDGPREWLECLDRLGCTRARLHLLPDTDFLAWDALTASCQPERHPPRACSWRPDRAAVMQFRLRELAGLALLEPGHSASLSPLSSGIAARIAQAESAVLLK